MRNVLAHEYFGIDSGLVWQIIKNDLPELKDKIGHILKAIQKRFQLIKGKRFRTLNHYLCVVISNSSVDEYL